MTGLFTSKQFAFNPLNKIANWEQTAMSIIVWIIIGGIAGFIAEKVTKSSHGLLTNIIIGMVGSVVGGYIARVLDLRLAGGFIDQLVVATVGAILLVFLYKQIKK